MAKFGYETTDSSTYGLLLKNAKSNRRYATEAESLLWEYLRNKKTGYKFRRQHPIDEYIPDFVCLSHKLVVEVDGGYHNIGDKPLKDEERTAYLNFRGFEVLRFSNEEILQNIECVVQQIKDKIMNNSQNETSSGTPLLRRGRGRFRERYIMVCPLRRSSRSCWAAWCRDRATGTRRCGIWPIC